MRRASWSRRSAPLYGGARRARLGGLERREVAEVIFSDLLAVDAQVVGVDVHIFDVEFGPEVFGVPIPGKDPLVVFEQRDEVVPGDRAAILKVEVTAREQARGVDEPWSPFCVSDVGDEEVDEFAAWVGHELNLGVHCVGGLR